MEMKESGIKVESLNESHAEIIPRAYIPIFESHPWHEQFRCANKIDDKDCNAGPYVHGCDDAEANLRPRFDCEEFKTGKLFKIDRGYQKCNNCNQTLTLKPYYTPEGVTEDYLSDIRKPGFVGFGAFKAGNLVAMCWGYDLPYDKKSEKDDSVWYDKAGELLLTKNVDPRNCFYHTESGTIFKERRKGIGTYLLNEMLKAHNSKNTHVTFRTINEDMRRCYEKIFKLAPHSLKGHPTFNDPNPAKRQTWYAFDITSLK